MTDPDIKKYLKEHGYPEHVVDGGREALLEDWKQFVEEVEHGYEFGLFDYRNDLDTREIIARVGLDAEVAALDERFHSALTARDKKIWESSVPEAFWVFGYPKNASEELLEDLKAEGVL